MSNPKSLHESEAAARRRFAARLTHARRTAGMNHIRASEICKIPVERIRDIEASLVWPTSDELDMLADKYGVLPAWLTCTAPYDL